MTSAFPPPFLLYFLNEQSLSDSESYIMHRIDVYDEQDQGICNSVC